MLLSVFYKFYNIFIKKLLSYLSPNTIKVYKTVLLLK